MRPGRVRQLLRWQPRTWRQALASAVIEVAAGFAIWFGLGLAQPALFPWDTTSAVIFALLWVTASMSGYAWRHRHVTAEGRRSPTAPG
jgi:hypothetical protein